LDIKEVIDYSLTFAEAASSPHFHKTSFRVRKKIFATLDEKESTLVVKFNEVDQSVFSDLGKEFIYPVPGGWGKKGWTILKYESLGKDIIKDALCLSYCTVAPAKLAALYM
jgi:predicted DNA-binding protein (MmcQ/YjbR family)